MFLTTNPHFRPDPSVYSYKWAEQSARHPDTLLRARRKVTVLRLLGQSAPIRTVLDVGCGSGVLVDLLTCRGYDCTGIDSSPPAIGYALQHFSGKFMNCDIRDSGRLSGSAFDCIVLSHVLEHCSDPVSVLKRILCLLSPSGVIYITVPNRWSERQSGWRSELPCLVRDPEHLWLFSILDLVDCASLAGLQVVYADTWISPHLLSDCFVTWIARRITGGKSRSSGGCTRTGSSVIEWLSYSALGWLWLLPSRLAQATEGDEITLIASRQLAVPDVHTPTLPRPGAVQISAQGSRSTS